MNIFRILLGKRARKIPFSTLLEVLKMRFGSQRLLFQEYIDYCLHELDDLNAEERSRLYDLNGRNLPGTIMLNNIDEATDYLRTSRHYPLFAKPSHGAYGWGALGLQNYLPESDSIVFLNGQQRKVTEWVESLNPEFARGILFQELLRPHPEIARICGPRVSSIRVTSARLDGKNTIVSAVWRIPAGSNMVDNFQHGASGNLLGGVNVADGRITRVVGRVNNRIGTVTTHPDTGMQFDQYILPDWSQLTEICKRAANYLMGMNLHHWDIALTERGPVIVENNEIADLDLHQHANRKGFWSEEIETVRRQSYPRYWEQLGWSQKKLANLMRKIDTFF